ncbi:MAG TPA: HAD-IIB family hydrolase [Deltaproteobacteria bacterium]|nr:HAD-IIB family hydrolase [Deltaproteobacteria bacterium]HOI06184.1 HAD-IIB family hydrolase [Deltaproteobacteria bacterium]
MKSRGRGTKGRRMVIFTDLDGSLLDHADYSYRRALPALKKIRANGIPLVMCTSKTRKEVEVLRGEMGVEGPFIAENGGGIFFPMTSGLRVEECIAIHNHKCIPLGVPYGMVRAFLKSASRYYPIKGFGDMTVEEVVRHTGLPREKALLAKYREFTEPFVIEREESIPALKEAAHEAGISITRGGRFFHFTGLGSDKGRAVRMTRRIFEKNWKASVTTVGVGDSRNDLPMLQQVDIPVLIPKHDGSFEDFSLPNLIRAPFPGSRGWNEVMYSLLN